MPLAQDLKFAIRTIQKSPGFSLMLVVILSVGIGANTAMFTLINGILLKPLPSPEGHRILHIGTSNVAKGITSSELSYPDFADYQAQARAFSALALVRGATFKLSDNASAAELVADARITAGGFQILRATPLLGRAFKPEDDRPGAEAVAILGHGLWMRRYGGDRGVIGRTVRVGNETATVIGVMPAGMRFPATAELWLPLPQTAESGRRELRQFSGFGRLKDGVTIEEARAEAESLGRQLEAGYPVTNRGVRLELTPYTQRAIGKDIRLVLLALQGAVGFLLLVVCANAANLLLSRSLLRRREIAIRSALGASRIALVRQLLVESVLYAAGGGVLGMVFANWGIHAFDLAISGTGRPYWLSFEMDYRVWGFLSAIVLFAGIAFGLAPALHLLRSGIGESLKEGQRTGTGKSTHRLASSLVVAQLAVTMALLVGIGLLARTIVNIFRQGAEFDSAQVLTVRLRLPSQNYPTAEARGQFQEKLLAALRPVAGVESAAIGSNLPLNGHDSQPAEPEGYPLPADGEPAPVATLSVSPGYFSAFGIGMTAGRDFAEADGRGGADNIVVNRRFAEKYWPGEDPLGKRVRIRGKWMTVVGVCANVRQNRATVREPAAVIYTLQGEEPQDSFFVVVRGSIPPESLARLARQAIRAVDAELPASGLMTMKEVLYQAHWPHRVFGAMFGIFGIVAAALAGLGIYSVMTFSVNMRTQEIGIRMAMGASRADVRRMIARRGLGQAAIGLAIGLVGAFVVTRGLRALLVEVSATDPLTYLAVAAFQTALVLLACWTPASRAAKLDPLQALRQQ